MATLPDLDTSAIGIIAFWNALDHGVPEIDPTDVLSCPNVDTYEQYDNGIQGTMHLDRHDGSKVSMYFRVKGDGWFITWFPRYSVPEPDQIDVEGRWSNATDPDGYYNLLWDWTYYSQNINPSQSALERAIYTLAQYLDNWGSITYSESDVGHYSYHFSEAIGMYQDSEREECLDSGTTKYFSGGLSYTSGVSLYYSRAVGVVYFSYASSGNSAKGKLSFEDLTVVSETTFSSGGTHRLEGSINILSEIASSGVVYRNSGYIYNGTRNIYGKISRIIIFG